MRAITEKLCSACGWSLRKGGAGGRRLPWIGDIPELQCTRLVGASLPKIFPLGSSPFLAICFGGKRFGWKKTWVRNASIYVLNDKVAYFSGNRRLGNVEFADARFQHLQSSVEDGSVLLLCNEDCSIFNPKMSGSVDVRISTANAADLHAMLLSHQQERC